MKLNENALDPRTRSASLLLTLLMCADVVFIILHVIYFQTQLITDPLFSLSKDNGYSEFHQYTKYLWLIILLAGISVTTKTPGYLAWVTLFTYFLGDDALQIHERYGRIIAENLNFSLPLNIRLQDIGELIVTSLAGIIIFPLLALAYWRGTAHFRKISLDIATFLAILIFFGVAVDMVHEAVSAEGILDHLVFRILEEGGEMIVTSLLLSNIFLLSVCDGTVGWFLHERIKNLIPKRSR